MQWVWNYWCNVHDVPMTPTSPPIGLSSAEVAERVARGEVNRVRRSNTAEYLNIVHRNVVTLFNALIVPAAIALLLIPDYKAGLAASGMMLTNLVIGLFQEVRAKRHLDRLTLLAEGTVRVRRDGSMVEIKTGDVVRDDVVLLAAGDSVAADGTVVESRFLEVDEALLTGESDPVSRKAGDRLLSGSFCVAGEGEYRAEKVGRDSFAQRTAAEARVYSYNASPLQRAIDQLLRVLSAIAVALSVVYFVLYKVRGDIDKDDFWRMIAATITSMIPQGLVLMTTLAFVLGAVRMARRGAIVQRLNAVESMAAIDTLCMDKTGTLTTNRLRLEKIELLAPMMGEEVIRERLRRFATASLDRGNKSLAALRAALGESPCELLDQLPFKSQNRYSAVRIRAGEERQLLVLGAPEALLGLIADNEARKATEASWQTLMKTGLRLLLFAEGLDPGNEPFRGTLEGYRLAPLALLGLSDELRPEAGRVLELLAGQGIEFRILSGDNAETVRATVEPLGRSSAAPALHALASGPVVTGAELAAATDTAEIVRTRSVFGRVSPAQKVEVVSALKSQGRRVAMVGDGVNDVLPIKTADLGIAMGEGSQAAKTVSGLVLETNSFELLPQALEEGRTILRNLRRAGKLFLLKNVFMLLLIVGGLTLFQLFPLEPQQVTLFDFLTLAVPAFLIMLSRGEAAPATGYFRAVGGFALRSGVVIGVTGLVVVYLARHAWDIAAKQEQVTLLLTALVLLGLDALIRILGDGAGSTDRLLYTWIAAAVPLYLVAMYWPLAADFFLLTPLSPMRWAQVFAVAAPASVLARLAEYVTTTSAAATRTS
jgi:cation-transporting ATPase E